jgi:hypothetical protein
MFVRMNPIEKTFINYNTNGTFTLTDCTFCTYDIYLSSSITWNGTFMILNTGSFNFTNINFENILINGTNVLIDAKVVNGKEFIINNCNLTNCNLLGSGKNDEGSPIYIIIEFSGRFEIKNTNFKNCRAASDTVQGLNVQQ